MGSKFQCKQDIVVNGVHQMHKIDDVKLPQ